MISVRDILLLAWREIWTTMRHPVFWLVLIGLPTIMIGVGWMVGQAEEATLPFTDNPPLLVIDGTGQLETTVRKQLRRRRWAVEARRPDELSEAREEVRLGDATALIRLNDDTILSGRVVLETIDEPGNMADAVSDAVLLAVAPHLTAEAGQSIAALTSGDAVIHVTVEDKRDPGETEKDALTLFTLASGMVLLFPAVILGGVVSQGMRRDRRSGFSTLLVCATRPENAIAGQILGGLVLGLIQLALLSASFTVFGLMLASTEPSAQAEMADIVTTADTDLLVLVEARLGEFSPDLTLADLVVPALVYLFLAGLGTLSYMAWGIAASVGASSNEEETDAVKQGRAIATLGLVYPSMFLAYMALLDPSGALAGWGQLVPLVFPVMVWGRYLHGVANFWSLAAVVAHFLVSIALVRLVARTYVTGETLWELARRQWTRWRQRASP